MDATAKELLVPGAMVVLSTPQGEFTVSYGTTTLGATIPPRADTHFRIASNTKTMTAALIVQMAQEGRLDLNDPVSKYVSASPTAIGSAATTEAWLSESVLMARANSDGNQQNDRNGALFAPATASAAPPANDNFANGRRARPCC